MYCDTGEKEQYVSKTIRNIKISLIGKNKQESTSPGSWKAAIALLSRLNCFPITQEW